MICARFVASGDVEKKRHDGSTIHDFVAHNETLQVSNASAIKQIEFRTDKAHTLNLLIKLDEYVGMHRTNERAEIIDVANRYEV